jgi:2,3-bisphosphoglycerate-independent phosphoglycerate mutase
MKYIVILCDGMADEPLDELGGKTPMEVASKPNMNNLAKGSQLGLVRTVPEGMSAGSDIANLSVLGYDPKIYYTGRSPIEALSIGIPMEDTDVAFRCNFVTLSEKEDVYGDRIILDHGAEDIRTSEASILIEEIKKHFATCEIDFYTGISYRNIMIEKNSKVAKLTPPHDVLDRRIGDYLPSREELKEMMVKSYDILKNHPINIARKEKGLRPGNSIWFWGAGTKPKLPDYQETLGKKTALFSAVDLLKGIGVGANITNIQVPGANGGLETNYEEISEACVQALVADGYDFVYLHLEAPDEMSHQGSLEDKILAIENIDKRVIPILLDGLKEAGEDFRLLILPDHFTPVKKRTHIGDPVPYMLYDSRQNVKGYDNFNEKNATATHRLIEPGHELIKILFGDIIVD